jgi:hypothetical protein
VIRSSPRLQRPVPPFMPSTNCTALLLRYASLREYLNVSGSQDTAPYYGKTYNFMWTIASSVTALTFRLDMQRRTAWGQTTLSYRLSSRGIHRHRIMSWAATRRRPETQPLVRRTTESQQRLLVPRPLASIVTNHFFRAATKDVREHSLSPNGRLVTDPRY